MVFGLGKKREASKDSRYNSKREGKQSRAPRGSQNVRDPRNAQRARAPQDARSSGRMADPRGAADASRASDPRGASASRSARNSQDYKRMPKQQPRSGSQRRMPIERIIPSHGHRPSQQSRQQSQRPRRANQSRMSAQQAAIRTQAAGRAQFMRQSQGSQRTQRSQQFEGSQQAQASQEFSSMSVAELRRADRKNQRTTRANKASKGKSKVRRYVIAAIAAVVVIVGGVVGGIALYNSSAFAIKNVTVSGVEHLTAAEMTQLANVPDDTTLLRVDTKTIEDRVKANSWVENVQVKRVFPDTLELVVTEREMAAIVEIPVKSAASIKQWAISKDNIWLMPIPEKGTDAAKTTSAKVYEDAETVLHIKDVPYGTVAEIGKQSTDVNVNNALSILSGMTTELADQVVEISAGGVAETTLILANGVEVAFGEAKDIRDKERVVLEILARNPDNVSYINVRMVETPTWRAI